MSDIRYDGRVAVITGAGGGLGKTYALEMARRGAKVVVNDLGGKSDGTGAGHNMADQVVEEIKKAGGEAVANYDSVSTPEGGEGIIQSALSAFGKVDVVVNNAGILRDKTFLKLTPEELGIVIDVHLKGAFYVSQPAFRAMKEKGYGRFIFTSSAAGILGNFGQTNYGAAKAALMGITFTWSIELAKYGITVNALAPSGMTRMVGSMPGMENRPVAPEMNPDLNGAIVAYLASERAAHVNGQIFGRRGFAFTIFQTPRPIASMHKDGGWTPTEIADHFDSALGEHLQQIGIPQTRREAPPAKK